MTMRFESVTPLAAAGLASHTGWMNGRRLGIGVVVAVGLALIAGSAWIYVSAYGTGDPQSERSAALKAARQTQSKTKGRLLVAAYLPNAGAHEQSNTGHSCFGRTVEVRMVWKDANFDNAGATDEAHTPKALILTADATSGTICFVSSAYGPAAVAIPAGSIYLYGPRQSLVTSTH